MRGGGHSGAHPADVLDDGDGQGRALHRVGTGAKLVEQDEAMAVRLPQNRHYISHMCRESGQILFNALLIADVRQHPLVDRNGTLVRRRDVETALGHQRQQAKGLEGDGLAAGIGASDDQCIKGVSQLDVNGHRLLRVQQRMAGLAEVDGAVPPDLRPDGVHFIGELAPGKDQVQVHQGVIVPLNVLPVGRHIGGQLRQDALDLLLFLGLQLNIFVVGLNDADRLDEQRGAGGGNVVDQARHIALVLCLDRHHKTAVPLGDDGLLQNFGVAGRRNDLLQNLAAFCLGRPHMTADVRQLRAGGVGDRVLVHDAAVDLLL